MGGNDSQPLTTSRMSKLFKSVELNTKTCQNVFSIFLQKSEIILASLFYYTPHLNIAPLFGLHTRSVISKKSKVFRDTLLVGFLNMLDFPILKDFQY